MKVVRKTGLAPVKLLISIGQNKSGEIAGFPVKAALQMIAAGQATQDGVVIPSHLDVDHVADVEPGVLPGRETDAGAVTSKSIPTVENTGVEIPENWSGLHHLQLVALAKRIDPSIVATEDKKVTEVAAEVIQKEVDRRAAAA